MKNIAMITGATGGLGEEFVKLMMQEELDEVWAIARNEIKLQKLKENYGDKIRIISKDLTKSSAIKEIEKLLKEQSVNVRYMINNAGVGKMGTFSEFSFEEMEDTIRINCFAPAMLSNVIVPYMQKNSHILNISSQASFQPDPYLNLYAASKAFVTSYSRGLNQELKKYGITVTAVCPGWVDTELLRKEWNGHVIKFPGIVSPKVVAEKAVRDAKRGKDMSVYGAYVKWMQLFSKLVPHKMVMNLWIKSIDQYKK